MCVSIILTLTVKTGQAYPPQESINELIIWKMNLLVVATTSIKIIQICIPAFIMSSEFLTTSLSVFGQIEKSLNG